MTRVQAIQLLAKLRDVAEHKNTSSKERAAALTRIQQIKGKFRIGQYEEYSGLQPGRPRKPVELRRSVTVKFLVTKAEHKRLQQRADVNKVSVSEYIRAKVFSLDDTCLPDNGTE